MKKATPRLNLVDKVVGYFSPENGMRRARSRAGLDFMAGGVSRTGAGSKGSLGNWLVKRLTRYNEGRERLTITDRAEDLAANNPHAASIIDSSALNITGGAGLTPQSKPSAARLGITEEQAREVAEQAEWAFYEWSREADAEGEDTFADIQYQNVRAMMSRGEYLTLPVYPDTPGRKFSLALQQLDSRRLRTPHNLTNSLDVRDGIKLGKHSERLIYYIADPDDGKLTTSLNSNHFAQIPARRGHLKNIFHGFHKKEAEQIRGVSLLAPCLKPFKDYDDYIDFELVGAIIAASFPVFIETPLNEDPENLVGGDNGTDSSGRRIKEYSPGQVMYGNAGQKPHIIKNERPGGSFPIFVETMLRAVGAATGLPYEIVAKDFSKTNYSSARAALLEAWRFFSMYQTWLVNHFTQPVWEMVFEEAWLRGMIKLPKGSPDFYSARSAWTNASWTPPKRGWIDPVKEVAAGKEAIISNMSTLADWYAEQGKDWEEQLRQIERERQLMKDLGLTMADLPGFDLAKIASQPDQP